MNTWLGRLRRWLARLWLGQTEARVQSVPSMDNVPAEVGNLIYIVQRDGVARWLVLACPCGCGDRIDVNLSRSRRPHWRLKRDGETVTLTPSLWRPDGTCGSHFWLRRNKIEWVRSFSRPRDDPDFDDRPEN